MSRGMGARANLRLQDEKTIIYEYGGYNLNEDNFKNEAQICDGIIIISRNCFLEPEIHQKIEKMPSGKKKIITKRISIDGDCSKMIKDGLIVIENCSNCWKTTDDEHIDIMALRILFKLFSKYQEEGKVPESISYNV